MTTSPQGSQHTATQPMPGEHHLEADSAVCDFWMHTSGMGRNLLLLCRHYYANQASKIVNASKECSNPGIFNQMNATKFAAATKWKAPWFVGEYGIGPYGCLKTGVRLRLSSARIRLRHLSHTCPPMDGTRHFGHHLFSHHK